MNSYKLSIAFLFILVLSVPPGSAQGNSQTKSAVEASSRMKSPMAGKSGSVAQKIVREGIAVEFTIDPVAGGKLGAWRAVPLQEGDDGVVRFKITDTATGTAMTDLHPSAWMDIRKEDEATDSKKCTEKIQSFMQGMLGTRPEIDLNTYYILALNHESNISVIDPLLGFGSSKLLTLVMLKDPGEDWALSNDEKKLFVTIPLANQVVVVDTSTWKVIANVDAGPKPTRLAFQPDEKYLWVGNDATGSSEAERGVTVIDSARLEVVTQIRTGAGHHEIAFTDDDRYAFVTNKQDGTLSIIDVRKLVKIKDIKIGASPTALAFSALSKAVYVVNEADGTIVAVDGQKHEILTRMKAKPGLRAIRFAPGGRWGFVVNGKENVVHIFDSSVNGILHNVEVGKGPDQISFTESFAYIRSTGTEEISMIPLNLLGKEGTVSVAKFPGGQIPPGKSSTIAVADAIVPTPEGGSVLVANPADKIIYYYEEGMAAPMGSFQNYRREPKAVLVIDRSLQEKVAGVYSTNVKLTKSGNYDVAFLLDSPRIVHCFDLAVKPNPALKKDMVALHIEPLLKDRKIPAGKKIRLQFKLTDPEANQPKVGLKDVGVLIFLAPGIWQKRDWAKSMGDGIYEVTFTVPQSGVYYVFFQCPSLKVQFNQLPHLILQATEENSSHSMHQPSHSSSMEGAQKETVKMSLPDLVVHNQEGKKIRFYSDLVKDKVVAINFIFTTCTTICPPLAATFSQVQNLMGERLGKDFYLISVSVDPATDTPERLKAWGEKFGAKSGWTLVTGEKPEIDKLLKALGAFTARKEDHLPLILLGNDVKGIWTRVYGLTPATQLAKFIEGIVK